jgi:peptidoglycan hydrolase-like protein with peptidoglycan-binding domain
MNRAVRILLAAGTLAAVITSVWRAPMTPQRAQAQVPQLAPCAANSNLVIGSKGESVSCLQFTLAMLGFYPGEMTGEFDQPTSTALTLYQAAVGLRPDGKGTERSLVKLGIFSGFTEDEPLLCLANADIKPGEKGDGVACLQRALQRLGYYAGDPDGVNGDTTVEAVKSFQSSAKLNADGVGGPVTLAALDIWSGVTIGDLVIPPRTSTGGGPIGPSGPVTYAPDGPWPAPQQDSPFWSLTAEGIPFYGNRGICGRQDANTIAAEFARDGADIPTQQWAVYIASRETSCRFDGVNINAQTRDDSHCAFQINALAGVFEPTAELGRKGWTKENIKASMQACADAASDLWVFCGRGPWLPPYYCRPPWKDPTS